MNVIQELVLPAGDEKPDFEHGSIFFVGTATVIIRYAGFTILTDPNFLHAGEQVHVGYGLRATRLTDPAINIEDLPPIDLVVLSHMHEDHFDRLVQKKLDKTIPIVTTPQAAKFLKSKKFTSVYQLKTWQTFYIAKGEAILRLTAMPGKHGPGPLSYLLPSVMGSMLEFQTAGENTEFRIYISGDTLVFNDLRKISQRFPEIDLALLHLGGTKIFGIMLTMDAQQGVEMIRIISPHMQTPNPLTVIPIHFNDYNVFKSSGDDFVRAFNASGLENQVHYLYHGQTYTFEKSMSRA